MLRYIIWRLLTMVPVFFLVATLAFSIMHLLPGDPAMLMLSGQGAVSPEQICQLRKQLGLDNSLLVQFGDFVLKALRGNLGNSTRLKSPVLQIILAQFPYTAALSGGALLTAVLIGLPLGILAAVRKGTWIDSLSMAISLLGVSLPAFLTGLLLLYFFSFKLHIFAPFSTSLSFKGLVLPAFTLGIITAGLIGRLLRSSLLDILGMDYIQTARSKGLSERKVLVIHALRNAAIPVITILGLQLATFLTGAAVTETVFSRPGLGRLIVNAIIWKDYPLVQGAVLFAAALFLLVNLIVDLSYTWVDPRIHYD